MPQSQRNNGQIDQPSSARSLLSSAPDAVVLASFQAQGISAAVVDPRDAVPGDGGLVVSGRRLSLIWNKINTVYWNGLVAQAKTSLALLHEPRFQDRFTPEERALIDGLVPWTRTTSAGDGVTIGRGTPPDQWRRIVEESWVSLDSFLFGGRLVGFGAKASVKDRVNLFQGGSKLSVIVSHA